MQEANLFLILYRLGRFSDATDAMEIMKVNRIPFLPLTRIPLCDIKELAFQKMILMTLI